MTMGPSELRIDPKSVASHCLTMYAGEREVGIGTGFIIVVDHISLLITNYHVLSGRHPKTGLRLQGVPAMPDRVLIPVLRRNTAQLSWRPLVQSLNTAGETIWSEHPRLGSRFDVVALPIHIPTDVILAPYSIDPGPNVALHPGSEVAIVGFPEGMAASGLTAIWKSGTIASEPDLTVADEEFFWVDANTRKGMSGSPVIARRFGGALMTDGDYGLHTGTVDRMLGVYAGRAFDASDMTLGRVWKWSGVQEVVQSAISMCQRGILQPWPSQLVYSSRVGGNMVEIDVRRSVDVPVRNQAGTVTNIQIILADFIRDFVLSDDRFGLNLERVKMAATLGAAVDAALSNDGILHLEDAQYGLFREVIEQPSKPYNASIARYILPHLEYVMNAGQNQSASQG